MKISKPAQWGIAFFLFFSITYTSASDTDEKNSYVEELSYVGKEWSVKYRVIKEPFKIVPIEINQKPLNESEKKQSLDALKNLYDFLSKRPNNLKREILGSATLNSDKYEGILVVGGESDWLYLFPKNKIKDTEFEARMKFLKDFRR